MNYFPPVVRDLGVTSTKTKQLIRVGHSPDPDDAFMFHALANNHIDTGDYQFTHELVDIETLNQRAFRAELELTAVSIADAIRRHAPEACEVLVCGGGVHNRLTMERLAAHLRPIDVCSTDSVGFDPDWVEAAAFAWLAARTMDGMPGNLPAVTGATHPVILGGIYAGG